MQVTLAGRPQMMHNACESLITINWPHLQKGNTQDVTVIVIRARSAGNGALFRRWSLKYNSNVLGQDYFFCGSC